MTATLTTLVSFNATEGDFPAGSLLFDAAGDLLGTSEDGGASYTAPPSIVASGIDDVTYTVTDQQNNAVADGSATVSLEAAATTGPVIADLATDWSNTSNPNTSNPNGTWEYRQGTSDLPLTSPWTAAGSGAPDWSGQPAWAPSNIGGNFLPAEFEATASTASLFGNDPKSPGNNNVVPGDVVMHTVDGVNGNPSLGEGNYLFTSNVDAGAVTISGMVWDASLYYGTGRPQDWSLLLDGAVIASGVLDGSVSRSEAQTFDVNETLRIGDRVELDLSKDPASPFGFFVGSALTIASAVANGPTITPVAPLPVRQGQTTEIATVAPGFAGDTLSLQETGGSGTLSLQTVGGVEEVIYTAPSSIAASGTDDVTYTVTDRTRAGTATGSAMVVLDAGPTISGMVAGQIVASGPTINPFANVTIAKVDDGLTETVTITVSPTTDGTLSDPNAATDGSSITNDVFTVSGSGVAVSEAVDGLVFTQGAVAQGQTETTDFTVTVQDSLGLTASDNNTSVVAKGLTITPVTPLPVEQGHTTEIATVAPGFAGDTLSLQETGGSGTLSLQTAGGVEAVIYTAPPSIVASGTDDVTYTVTDQQNNAVADGSATVSLEAAATTGPVIADLATDWSNTSNPNTSNPNGTWEYRQGTSDLPLTSPWTAAGSGAPDWSGQPAWAPSNIGGSFLPAELEATASTASQFASDPNSPGNNNVVPGDVVMHTVDGANGNPSLGEGNYLFTSDVDAGAVTISGMVWDAGLYYGTGRPQDWSLLLDGVVIASGVLDGSVTRSEAQKFDVNETLGIGDRVELELSKDPASPFGFFVGSELKIASAVANGPTITPVAPLPVRQGQTTEIATVAPGFAGDTLSLQETGGSGTLSLQTVGGVEEVIYTAPSSIAASGTDDVTYTVTDQRNNAVADGGASVSLEASASNTPTLTTLVSFNGTDGVNPLGGLIADGKGNLFGTTSGFYAVYGDGSVFEIADTPGGYTSTPTTLYSFTGGTDGADPWYSLITDANGDVFGTTTSGGAHGFGTVFEIANTPSGYTNTPTTLYSFTGGTDGALPFASPIADSHGDLFGTTSAGGANNDGTVFEIANTPSGYASSPTTLLSFTGGTDGAAPFAGLIADSEGDLFGTTSAGGASGGGTVFEIVKTKTGYASAPAILASFSTTGAYSQDGGYRAQSGGLITDAKGDLFGTETYGGPYGDGTVFEIINSVNGYSKLPITLATFNGPDGALPHGSLIADANGDLFGTTYGLPDGGTVFEIVNTATGYASTPITLINFNGSFPYSGLIADASGNLFGTTEYGGAYGGFNQFGVGYGTVYQLSNAGFVVDPLAIAGAQAGQTIGDQFLIDPFANVTITEPNLGQTETITVTPSTTLDGTLSDPNAATDGSINTNGTLTLTGAPAPVQADLQSVVFTPTAGQTGTTSFTIAARDTLGITATDTSTTVTVACYREGTCIATDRGDVPIERLAIGDNVVVASGGTRLIRWIGRRSYAGRFLAANRNLHPVCLRANALAENVPSRDLWVSPLHAMFLDGVLVPAINLVNGVTIFQPNNIQQVSYYHIELSGHDIILAEGAPSESFIDDESRMMFHNAHEFAALYPNENPVPPNYCAPRVTDGFVLEEIRQRLGERAGTRAARPVLPLRGFIDAADAGMVKGWAQNPNRPDVPVCLDILLDGVAVAQVLANQYRNDLAAAGFGSGRHAFSALLPMGSRGGEVTVRRSADGAALAWSCRQLAVA